MVAGILASTAQRRESGKSVDKPVLPALAAALGVALCRLGCGANRCVKLSVNLRATADLLVVDGRSGTSR